MQDEITIIRCNYIHISEKTLFKEVLLMIISMTRTVRVIDDKL